MAAGITPTEAHRMAPEQFTGGIILYHPDAEYFAVR
jgi:cobalamin-dependent methionine synthase I